MSIESLKEEIQEVYRKGKMMILQYEVDGVWTYDHVKLDESDNKFWCLDFCVSVDIEDDQNLDYHLEGLSEKITEKLYEKII